jgi:hypothetical protein
LNQDQIECLCHFKKLATTGHNAAGNTETWSSKSPLARAQSPFRPEAKIMDSNPLRIIPDNQEQQQEPTLNEDDIDELEREYEKLSGIL